jgi:hypothetical protein
MGMYGACLQVNGIASEQGNESATAGWIAHGLAGLLMTELSRARL